MSQRAAACEVTSPFIIFTVFDVSRCRYSSSINCIV